MNHYEDLDSSQEDDPICRPKMTSHSIRVMVAFLSLLGTAIMYITRVNLNITILAMVPQVSPEVDPFARLVGGGGAPPSPEESSTNQSSTQLISTSPVSNARFQTAEFDWTPRQQGIILGSFFYGYIATQIIGGRIAESHISSTKLILFGLGTSGLLNLVTPLLVRISLPVFVLTRIALGAAQGLVYPAFYTLFSKWIPSHERSTFIPWLDGGTMLGTVLISASSGQLIVLFATMGGWSVVFYLSGILALIWCIAWCLLVRSEPETHPFISKEELELILTSREEEAGSTDHLTASVKPAWTTILTSTVFFAVLAPKIAYGIVFDFITLKIPAYLQDVVQLPVDQNGLAIAAIMMGYMITLFTGGIAADCLLVNSRLGKTRVRKIFQLISGTIMTCSLLLIPHVGRVTWANVILLLTTMFGFGFNSGGDVPMVADLSGPLAGTVFALINTLCSISGFAVPYIVGVVIESAPSSSQLWGCLLNGCALLVVLGTGSFLVFVRADLQTSWVRQPEEGSGDGYIDFEKRLMMRRCRGRSRTESGYRTF